MKEAMAAALVAAAFATALAASPADEGLAFATLENGVSIGFALTRSDGQGAGGTLGEASLPRSNGVSRVLWDRQTGVYFGYRIEVTRQAGPRPFRVGFRPLERGAVERELKRKEGCPGCPAPVPLSTVGSQFPPAQPLGEGEVLTLDLLTNPTTGERMFDVVKVSAQPIRAEAMRTAVARALEGQLAIRRAAAHVARGRYREAVEEYQRALEVQPNDASVHNKLGICFQQLDNDGMARREYERALELNPAYAEVWNNVGTLEQSRKRFKQAVRAYKRAIELKPGLATPWKNLGNAYLALGQIPEAFEAYQEAFRIDPTILEAPGSGIAAAGIDAATQAYYIAKMLAQNGRKDASLEFLRRARDAGFRDFGRVKADPDFKDVVADPRFAEIAGQ